MKSLVELYKIGRGPSSSHTIGPEKACKIFMEENPDADQFKAILYGSLAKTGEGHGTDRVIKKTLHPVPTIVEFNYTEEKIPHPNTMDLIAFKGNKKIAGARVFSVGGGAIRFENREAFEPENVYEHSSFSDIASYCKKNNIRLWQFPEKFENTDFRDYMKNIWETMKASILNGLEDEGILPGGLNVQKKAKQLFEHEHIDESPVTKENRLTRVKMLPE